MSTIYALATARAKAGLGVIRISGPDALTIAGALCGPLPPERHAGLRRLRSASGDVLDEALVLTFAEGASYTGEAVVELHCHGSPAVLDGVLATLATQALARPAEPGEFTRRALENGRLDLAQVEGLADLIDAETELQRRQAWQVFSGGLRRITEEWRADLIRALALVEASIDFADEEVPDDVLRDARQLAGRVLGGIREQLAGIGVSERIRDGFEVAIVGPPNIGKSTLINRLSGRPMAIVSDVAGTTRDVLEVRLDLGGLPVTFLDTAGIHEATDPVEVLGVERAQHRASAADLQVILVEGFDQAPIVPPRPGDIVVQGKADLDPFSSGISGLSGQGIDTLVHRIGEELRGRAQVSATFTRHRHRAALQDAAQALSSMLDEAETDSAPELMARALWESAHHLGSVTGRIDVERVLDDVFSAFCLGK